jgi:phage protein D
MGLDILICVDDIPNEHLTQSVSSVEVQERMDQNTTYKLNFMVDVCDGDIGHSIETDTNPNKILSILANVGDQLVCLVKGPVTQQSASLQHGGSGSSLHVEGEDTGHNMDHSTNFQVSTAVTDADIVTRIITANENMIADVEPTPSSAHDEDNHSHVQRESDLSLLRTLARRNGYHFWITYSEVGLATGHFRPRSLDGEPAANLVINHEEYNIDSLQINADPRAPSQTVGRQLSLRNHEEFGDTVALTDNLMGLNSLSSLSESPNSIHLAPMVDDSGALQARSEAALRDSQWFINATCHTSLHRLCNKIVRFHTIVNIEGAGLRHNGKYYVTAVKHTIDAVSYNMDIELARNAWGNEPSAGSGLPSPF